MPSMFVNVGGTPNDTLTPTDPSGRVPASVPSLTHNVYAVLEPDADAPKYSLPPNATSPAALLPRLPGTMSFTITVPASVPSVFHSSWPFLIVKAEKYATLPTTVM